MKKLFAVCEGKCLDLTCYAGSFYMYVEEIVISLFFFKSRIFIFTYLVFWI